MYLCLALLNILAAFSAVRTCFEGILSVRIDIKMWNKCDIEMLHLRFVDRLSKRSQNGINELAFLCIPHKFTCDSAYIVNNSMHTVICNRLPNENLKKLLPRKQIKRRPNNESHEPDSTTFFILQLYLNVIRLQCAHFNEMRPYNFWK